MERYQRQIPQIGEEGQKKLLEAHVAIIGIGALGTHAASLLVRAGIGKLTLIDRDIVDLHNLQRQILFTEHDIGFPKVAVAEKHLCAIRQLPITTYAIDLSYKNIDVLDADIILDCTDNMQTRFLINDYAKKHKKTWIYGAATGWKGYIKVFDGKECFSCIFHDNAHPETCETVGVINTIPALIAALQVNEAIKIFVGKKYEEGLVSVEGESLTIKNIQTQQKEGCPVCGGKYTYLSGEKGTAATKLCGQDTWQITRDIDYEKVKKRIDCMDYGDFVKIGEITLFKDGRALIRAKTQEEAKSIYSKLIGD